MTDLIDIGFPREMFAHAGFLLIALAFIVRDALVLHSRAILAYCFFIGFASSASGGPAWHLIGWYVAFLTINVWQVVRLTHERHFDRLSEEEQRLASIAFPALDHCAVKRLLRRGQWVTLSAGDVLTVQNRVSENMYLLLEGEVRVWVDGSPVCELGPGSFVGEIGFIAESPATASASALSDSVRALAWNQKCLRREAAKKPDLRAAIHTALGADLARKISNQTLAVLRTGKGDEAVRAAMPESQPDGQIAA